ncbi:acetyl-CoA acetyltransferase [Spongiactinospora sp. 9N601]|uniref:acetyl-CoA acetyltransferase n=1 Tax=Spongiactinospora sp. 9N601 TaxID=3375149 RepID=UPI0037B18CF0
MAIRGVKDKVVIAGMGCTRFGDRWECSADDLIAEAAGAALASAGIGIEDVDAYWLGTFSSGNSGLTLTSALDVGYRPVTRVENYCATGSDAFRNACYAVAAGAYDVVMAIGVEKLKDTGHAGLVVPGPGGDGTAPGFSGPAPFSMLAPAYAHRYGLSERQIRTTLTHIACKNHANGARNERAQFRVPVRPEQVENAPLAAGMLGVYDCSGVADGAAAAVITRPGLAADPLYVKALSLSAAPADGATAPGFDYTSMPEAVLSARAAYAAAGITDPPAQLAMVELHDCFTPTELVLYEDLGLSPRGAGWRDALDGRFDLDGPIPVNPDGGLKSFGHPIGASGLRMLYECWLQLRGKAGGRQLEGGRGLALTQNLGGRPGASVSFVSVVGAEAG